MPVKIEAIVNGGMRSLSLLTIHLLVPVIGPSRQIAEDRRRQKCKRRT